MKLLEYEAKAILKSFEISVPASVLVTRSQTPNVALPAVLKSQVPTGGRGKAGGIVIVKSDEDLQPAVDKLFQLPIKDYLPQTLLAEELLDISHEYYLSILVDRSSASIRLIANKNGGVEVEENSGDSYWSVEIEAWSSEKWMQGGVELAEYLELPNQSDAIGIMIEKLYWCLIENDAMLIEINPLVLTSQNQLVAGDCKITLDDSAAFRHPEWSFEDKLVEKNFVTLDTLGDVATIANGAGLAMATVDAVADYGMKPANFLDIGGGASSQSVLATFNKIMEYQNVKAIIVNIFAGITRCDEVALAIIEARRQIDNLPPLFIRLAGTNLDLAKKLLQDENIALLTSLEDCLAAAKLEVSYE